MIHLVPGVRVRPVPGAALPAHLQPQPQPQPQPRLQADGPPGPAAPDAQAGCLSVLLGACARWLPCRRGTAAVHPAAADRADFAGAAPAPPRPPDADVFRARCAEADAALQAFIATPGFRIRQVLGQDSHCLELQGPGAVLGRCADVWRHGDHVITCDADLNGVRVPRLQSDRVLRDHCMHAFLGALGVMPASVLGIVPTRRIEWLLPGDPGAAGVWPVALVAMRFVEGEAIAVENDIAEVRRQTRHPRSHRAVAAAFIAGLPGVYQPLAGHYRHLVRTGSQGDIIVRGFDSSAGDIASCFLWERSIRQLFGLERPALLRMLNRAAQDTLDFAARHEGLFGAGAAVAADGADLRQALAAFGGYLAACRLRIASLRD